MIAIEPSQKVRLDLESRSTRLHSAETNRLLIDQAIVLIVYAETERYIYRDQRCSRMLSSLEADESPEITLSRLHPGKSRVLPSRWINVSRAETGPRVYHGSKIRLIRRATMLPPRGYLHPREGRASVSHACRGEASFWKRVANSVSRRLASPRKAALVAVGGLWARRKNSSWLIKHREFRCP